METKKCSKCGIEKPLSEFYNNSETKSGKSSQCKKCHKESCKKNYYEKYKGAEKLKAFRELKKSILKEAMKESAQTE